MAVHILMDGQLVPCYIKLVAMEIELNIMIANVHISDIKRYMHTVKDCTHVTFNSLSYNTYPTRIITEMARSVVYQLN